MGKCESCNVKMQQTCQYVKRAGLEKT